MSGLPAPSWEDMSRGFEISQDRDLKVDATRRGIVRASEFLEALDYFLPSAAETPEGDRVESTDGELLPGFANVRTVKVSARSKAGKTESTPFFAFSHEEWLEITVAYETNEDDSDSKDPEDLTLASQDVVYGHEIITVPVKVGTGTIQTTKHILEPHLDYKIKFERVADPPFSTIEGLLGHANEGVFMGRAEGKVLFHGPEAHRTLSSRGPNLWDLIYNLRFRNHHWNHTLNPETLVWEAAEDVGGNNNDPIPLGNLNALFQ